MDQYYPAHHAYEYKELSQGLSLYEYEEAQDFAEKLGLRLVN